MARWAGILVSSADLHQHPFQGIPKPSVIFALRPLCIGAVFFSFLSPLVLNHFVAPSVAVYARITGIPDSIMASVVMGPAACRAGCLKTAIMCWRAHMKLSLWTFLCRVAPPKPEAIIDGVVTALDVVKAKLGLSAMPEDARMDKD